MTACLAMVLLAGSWSGTELFQAPFPGPEGSARMEGCGNIQEEGVPPFPVRTVYVPVPPGASPGLSAAVSGRGRLETELMAVSGSAPGTAVLRGTVPLAGAVFAVIDLYPYAGGREFASGIDLELTWESSRGAPQPVAIPRGSLAEGLAPAGRSYWPLPRSRAQSPFHGKPWARISIQDTGPVLVTGSMLEASGCRVTGHSVSGLSLHSGPGTAFGDDPQEEHLLQEIPLLVNDVNGDGVFDPEDGVLFYAFGLQRWMPGEEGPVRLFHRYATHRVYWLTWGGAPGLRMEERDATPAGPSWNGVNPHLVTLEEDVHWFPSRSTDTGWIWQKLQGGGSVTLPYVLPGQRPGSDAEFTVRLALDQTSSCTVSLYVNGTLMGAVPVIGSGPRTAVFSGLSVPASGTARLDFATPAGLILFDRLDMAYDRIPEADGQPVFFDWQGGSAPFGITFSGAGEGVMAFDLTEPDSPVLLTGISPQSGQLHVGSDVSALTLLCAVDPGGFSPPDSISPASPGRLVGTVQGGDKLFVVPEALLEGAWAAAAVEEQLGWRTVVATTREIYDEFGQGVTDPGAIRSAVRWAMDSWDQGCRELVLLGDGHYDTFNRTTSQPVMVPPWIRLNGATEPPCVDDWYVMVHPGAVLPEIPVARLPVDSPLKLSAMVEKAAVFLSGTTAGSWMNRCVLLADDEWGNEGSAREGNHTTDSEALEATTLPRDVRRIKFYLVDYPWPPGTSPDGVHPEKPDARNDFIQLWNRGMGCLVFMGHGSVNQITHEKVLRLQDVPVLQNGGRLPLVILASCDLSAFDLPGVESIGEALVYSAGGGALSTVAATRKTFPGVYANYGFTRVLVDSLYNSGTPSGMAVWYSKLANSTSYSSNNRYYVLFGFPGLPVPRPGQLTYIGISPDSLRTGEVNTVTGSSGLTAGLVMIEILESGHPRVYSMLGGGTIQYTADGGTAWRGTAFPTEDGFTAECFIPVQARTGGTARAEGNAVALSAARAGAVDPAVMVAGEPPTGDNQGPDIEMWIQGHRGVDNPVVTGEAVFQADLADSSGICFLGGEGTRLRLFIDGAENDLGPYFSYQAGSTTRGRVSYPMPPLSQGQHLLILQAVDGVGNPAGDSLTVTAAPAGETVFGQVAVYPNPGAGQRCFSFTLSGGAWVTVGIHTVSGREIARLSSQCGAGYNQILWNGLDADGDPPATGAYIFHMNAEASAGAGFIRQAHHTGILAVVNPGGAE